MVRIYTLLYIYTFFALGAFCSCEPEAIDDGRDMRPIEGTYVIDYTFEGTRTSTRSIHQDQPANQRISSLTYLLYGKDGESKESMLLKRREIPDISKDTKWPLKRETMTWGQREALKDTLEQGMDYKVVFVANIDSSIVKWTADGTPNGTLWCPLREAESFSTAYLQLPARPFTDSDMFYLFTTSVNGADKEADRDHPYNCPVLLQRVVTRTDFFTERLPEWDMTIKDTEGKVEIPDTVKTYFQRKYSINSLVYWVTYVHNVVYSFYRSMIYCYINSTQRCAGSIVIDIIPTNGADKRKFFPFAPYFPVTNVIKRYFYPYFPAIIGIKGYSFPYFPYLSGIMKIKTALYSLFSRLDWHKTVVFPCLGEIYEGIRSLSWEIPVT